MKNEAAILERLKEHFSELDTEKAVTAHHRIYLYVPEALLLDLLKYAKEELDFGHLTAITGMDNGEGFEFIYHIAHDSGVVLSAKCLVPGRDEVVIPSVLPIYEGATFYERELEGLLGIRVEGLPAGRQYPLPDNWPKGQYPLRKDWAKPTNAKSE